MSKYEKQEELKREELSQKEQLLKTEADNTKLTDDSKNVKMTDACEKAEQKILPEKIRWEPCRWGSY